MLVYDRLHFWLDYPLPAIPPVLRDDDRVSIIPRSMSYHPMWQTKFELLQPDSDLLRACIDMAGVRHRVELNSAEIKLDLITRTRSDAKSLQALFLEHLIVTSASHPVTIKQGTVYYMPPATPGGKPVPRSFVIYADNPSKETGRPCCHLEWRLKGVSILEGIGLVTLEDCIAFDHRHFWSKHMHLFAPPTKAALSRWLDPENANVSPTMLTKRADQFRQQYLHDGMLILQNCFVENREIVELLTPVDNALFLPK